MENKCRVNMVGLSFRPPYHLSSHGTNGLLPSAPPPPSPSRKGRHPLLGKRAKSSSLSCWGPAFFYLTPRYCFYSWLALVFHSDWPSIQVRFWPLTPCGPTSVPPLSLDAGASILADLPGIRTLSPIFCFHLDQTPLSQFFSVVFWSDFLSSFEIVVVPGTKQAGNSQCYSIKKVPISGCDVRDPFSEALYSSPECSADWEPRHRVDTGRTELWIYLCWSGVGVLGTPELVCSGKNVQTATCPLRRHKPASQGRRAATPASELPLWGEEIPGPLGWRCGFVTLTHRSQITGSMTYKSQAVPPLPAAHM